MGYRIRLGKISKEDSNIIKSLTISDWEKLQEDTNYSYAPYMPEGHVQLFEVGKYYRLGSEHRKPFYSFDVYREFECEFDILTKEGLKYMIQQQAHCIKQGFEETQTDEEKIRYFEDFKREWCSRFADLKPYRLDEPEHCDGMVASSWKYEYSIFNLVYIYRTFDWDNDYLIYSGW